MMFCCVRCRREVESDLGRCPVCRPNAIHRSTAVRVCETNGCGHWVRCRSGHGCELNPNGPCWHDNHLLSGGGCFDSPPVFQPMGKLPPVDIYRKVAASFERIDEVSLVTFHFNPMRYHRLRETYYEWLPTLGPLVESLRCYELVFDDDAQR